MPEGDLRHPKASQGAQRRRGRPKNHHPLTNHRGTAAATPIYIRAAAPARVCTDAPTPAAGVRSAEAMTA